MAFPFFRRSHLLVSTLIFTGLTIAAAAAAPSQPVAPVRPVTDTYFGTAVVDPYRWMEDLKSPEVQAWMKAQNDYTRDYLKHLPDQAGLIKRIEELDNAAVRVGEVGLYGGRYFYYKTTAKDVTPKLYVRDGLEGKERLLVDPQVLGGSGKRYAIGGFYPSPDGKFVAVQVAAGGSEEGVLRVIDVASGHPLSDSIDRIWGAEASWDPSDKFFFYHRLQKLGPNDSPLGKELDSIACLHHIGDKSDKDVVVLSRKTNPALNMVPTDEPLVFMSEGSPYVIGVIAHGVKNEGTFVASPADSASKGTPVWTKIIDVDDDVTDLAFKGHDLWMLSHKDAPHFKVTHLDLDHPDITKADVVVPASDLVVKGFGAAKDALYVESAKGGISQLMKIPYGQTASTSVTLPFAGSISDLSIDVQNDGAIIRLAGWTEPSQWYAYDPATDKVTNTNLMPRNPADFSNITSVEVTAPSADGTPVPLSIIYRKDLAMNGQNPCLLEGYGAYGLDIDPYFDGRSLALLEKGMVIAYAHVRGGGENGEDWHLAGQKLTKQNTISDFIGSAEYLIKNGYTEPAKLGGIGTSAGGILIGGALTQRPDLFTLCICDVGVMNPLRAEQGANGPGNTPEFGSVKDPDGFKALYAMDAYQHVKDGTAYPAVLLITGANDPRVDSWELFKMTARLQAATSSKNPVLLRIDYDAGHGMGSSKIQRDLLLADQAAFLFARAALAPAPVTQK